MSAFRNWIGKLAERAVYCAYELSKSRSASFRTAQKPPAGCCEAGKMLLNDGIECPERVVWQNRSAVRDGAQVSRAVPGWPESAAYPEAGTKELPATLPEE